MTILVGRCLQKGNGREITRLHGGVKVIDVVLMIRRVSHFSDHARRSGRSVRQVCSGSIILKWLVVRNIIFHRQPRNRRDRAAVAARGAVRISGTQIESAFEPTPGNTSLIEQVSNVGTAKLHSCTGGSGTHIAIRIGVID